MSQVAPMRDVIDQVDIFVTTTGNKDIIMAEDMSKMKNNAIVGNIGHFDNEIDMAGLMGWQGIKRQNIKPQVCGPLLCLRHPTSSGSSKQICSGS